MSKPRTAGDIRVIGLVAGTHVLEDIGMDVPHGVTVVIPGDKAVRSKDLWRALSQRCIFQLPTASPSQYPVSYNRGNVETNNSNLSAQVKALEAENKILRESLQQTSQSYEEKLNLILLAVQKNSRGFEGQKAPVLLAGEEVDGTAPLFIPSEIHPKDVDVRIDVQGEASQSNVSDTADRLRKIRSGAK